jgi:nitrate reductase gamma subunit
MDLKDLDDFMAESNARALRGRLLARNLFALGVFAIFLVFFLFVAAPNGPSAMTIHPVPITAAVAVPALGIAGLIVGLVWMIRILRTDPDPDAKAWRYRR